MKKKTIAKRCANVFEMAAEESMEVLQQSLKEDWDAQDMLECCLAGLLERIKMMPTIHDVKGQRGALIYLRRETARAAASLIAVAMRSDLLLHDLDEEKRDGRTENP